MIRPSMLDEVRAMYAQRAAELDTVLARTDDTTACRAVVSALAGELAALAERIAELDHHEHRNASIAATVPPGAVHRR